MINTKRPLEEKITLFWHQLFATGASKVDHYDEIMDMVTLFREKGMGDYRELLGDVARNPAILYWLDNNENHAYAVNENWGRELLELFSMGVGNYTEADVREYSRAFTGWTITPKLPRGPSAASTGTLTTGKRTTTTGKRASWAIQVVSTEMTL